MPPETLLLALLLLQVKHFVADFLLQPEYVWRNKGIYGHPGGLVHAGVHMAGSLPALLVAGAAPGLVAAVLLAEGVLHYHIDWGKEQAGRRLRLTQDRPAFWYLFGFDQLLHQLTYAGMLAVLLT